jgi:cellulose synthase/poly-beta-1,6-N-acetylglucosamine synthase-like glycosyltransferase
MGMNASFMRRMMAVALYSVFLIGAYTLIQVIPTLWISFGLSILFLYFSCLILLGFMESSYAQPSPPKKWPALSIVVPAYNRGKSLEKCIHHLKAMKYPHKVQIIVVNDASTDPTKEFLSTQKGIITVNLEKNGGKAHAINVGIGKATGELIAVVDGDSYPNPDCLMRMVPHFMTHHTIGAVTGVVRVNNPHGILQQIQDVEYGIGFGLYNTVLSHFDSLFVTPGPLSIYSREALQKTGGFDSQCITEDMEITFHLHQLGYSIILEPSAQIYSDVPETIQHLFKQRARWSRGGLYTLYKYRHEFFSEKGPFFGFFVPVKFVLDFSAVFFLLLLGRLAWGILSGVGGTFHTLSTISFEALPVIPIYLNSSLLFMLIMLGITGILIFLGARASGKKTRDLSILGTLLFIFAYGSFIVVVYFYSVTKAVMGVGEKW